MRSNLLAVLFPDHAEPERGEHYVRGRNGGYTAEYIRLCGVAGRCVKHPDRPQALLPFGPVPIGFYTRDTTACSECLPKKIARKAAEKRRQARVRANKTTAGIQGWEVFDRERAEWAQRWDVVLHRGGNIYDTAECAYCQDLAGSHGLGRNSDLPPLAVDHVVPIARGGADVWSNKVPSCRTCNSSKGSSLLWVEWTPRNPSSTLLEFFPPSKATP